MTGGEQLSSAYLRLHPEGAARLLEALSPERANAVLESVDVEVAAPVLAEMLPTYAADCVERRPPAEAAQLLERLESQQAAALLRHVRRDAREALLGALGPQWSVAFKLLLSYPAYTVGAWVEPRVLTLPDDLNAGEARERIAQAANPIPARVYVLTRSGRIRGAIRGLALLQVPSRRRLTAILEPAEALWAREPLSTAQEHPVWERHAEAPVVNRDEEFIGVITYAELRRAHRQLTRSNEPAAKADLAEVTELFAIGAGSLWQSFGDLMRAGKRR